MTWSRIGTGALVLLVLALCINWATDSFRITNVLTNSMSPTIVAGDFVVTQNDTLRAPAIGDIVIYNGKRLDGTLVAQFAHRIIAKDADGWIVKGDANPDPDVQHPTSEDITGIVIGRIPGIASIQSSMYLYGLLAGAAVFAGAYFVINRRK
jgi:signal peptidase I